MFCNHTRDGAGVQLGGVQRAYRGCFLGGRERTLFVDEHEHTPLVDDNFVAHQGLHDGYHDGYHDDDYDDDHYYRRAADREG